MSNEIQLSEKYDEYNVIEKVAAGPLALPTIEPGIAVSQVFGRGALGEVKSFGGVTLSENAVKTDLALANVEELHRIWNRGHSQWAWKHINLSQFSDLRNIRQIAAEMASKKQAINGAKWGQIKSEIKLKKLQEALENPNLDKWQRLDLEIELAELKEGLASTMTYIEGAMKDIIALNEMYEEIKERTHDFTEADYEKQETRNHLRRSLTQCLRDVRQQGRITKGEQEYLEQIGANVGKVQKLMIEYVAFEETSECWDMTLQHQFIEDLAEKLEPVANVKLKLFGLDKVEDKIINTLSYMETVSHNHRLTNEQKQEE
jgi:hypothetical protein